MVVTPGPGRGRMVRHLLCPPWVYVLAGLSCLASLPLTAYESWSGPTAGWAAPMFSSFGTLAFWDWLSSGAPASRGPHDPDITRLEMTACAAGFAANALWLCGLAVGPAGAHRTARMLGRIAFSFGLVSVALLIGGAKQFVLHAGGVLWLLAMAVLAFSQVRKPVDRLSQGQAGSTDGLP